MLTREKAPRRFRTEPAVLGRPSQPRRGPQRAGPLRPSRRTSLSADHYAGKWTVPEEDQRNDLDTINQLGYHYATSPDSFEKEAKLLRVLEAFHPYLMKYLRMIVRGTIPEKSTRWGRESLEMLRTLSRGGSPEATCKMLHLAFKDATTEDIYDTLTFCFMRAARQYDPFYAQKAQWACKEIDELPKEFTAAQLGKRVPFPCDRILRSLTRKGYLAGVLRKKKVVGYRRGHWPPPAKFFESGPAGFTYVLNIWFRFYLDEHIEKRMSELEPLVHVSVERLVSPSARAAPERNNSTP